MEVLKAIQKAKEVKSKLNNPEKKVGLCVGGDRSDGEERAEGGAGSQWNRATERSGLLCPGCTPPCPGCLTLGRPPPLCSPGVRRPVAAPAVRGCYGPGRTAFTITRL